MSCITPYLALYALGVSGESFILDFATVQIALNSLFYRGFR